MSDDAPLDLDVVEVPESRRFEARTPDGAVVGHADYEPLGQVLVFTHTEVVPELEGRGVAGTLVREAFDRLRADGRRVVAQCPYVRAWLRRHPEYEDLVERPTPTP